MILKSALISGIQRHTETFFEFHPFFNVIRGNTDSGKSSSWRGIMWALTNRPLGTEALMNDDMDHMMVELDFEDIGIIRRFRNRSGSKNFFQINDEKPFTGFGAKIPEPIAKALNLGPINFQHQKDQFFLLNESPTEVSRFLNRVANIDVIDRALSNSKKDNDKNSSTISYCLTSIKTLEKQLEQFNYLPEMERELEELEKFEKRANALGVRITRLDTKIQNFNELEQDKDQLSFIHSASADLSLLENSVKKHTKITKKIKSLSNLMSQSDDLQKEKDKISIFSQQDVEIQLLKLEESTKKIAKINQSIKLLVSLSFQHTDLLQKTETLKKEIEELNNQIKELTKGICTTLDNEGCPILGKL